MRVFFFLPWSYLNLVPRVSSSINPPPCLRPPRLQDRVCNFLCSIHKRQKKKEKKKNTPVSTSFRCGARAAHHDEYTGDFCLRIAYRLTLWAELQIPISQSMTPCWPPIRQAGRQAGREMSSLRPYETYPDLLITTNCFASVYKLFLPYGVYIGKLG